MSAPFDAEILSRLPGDVILVVDPEDLTVLYVSPSVERTLGFPPEEYAANVGFRQIHPDDRKAVSDAVEKILADPDLEWRDEVRIKHADGSWRWVEYLMANHLDDPAVRGVVSEFRDITDRKLAEDALRTSEEQFRSLVSTSTDIVVIGSPDRKISYVSPAAEVVLGWTQQEFAERFPRQLLHPDELMRFDAASKALREEVGARRTGLVRLRHKDGSWRWMELTTTNLLHHPDVSGVVTNFRDVTDRIEAEQALLRSEERFRALLEHSADAVLTLDRNARITWASRPAARVLGRQVEELVGTSGIDLVRPEAVDEVVESLTTRLEQPGSTNTRQIELLRGDGEWRWVEATSTNLLDNPAVGGLVVNFRDITERRRTEEALASSEGRFRALVQNSPVAVVVTDAEANVTWASPSVTQLLGWHPRELVGVAATELIHEDDHEVLATNLDRLLRREELPRMDVRIRHRDGSWRWIDVSGANLLDDPAINGILVNLNDVTELVEAQQALRTSEERFRALVQHSSDVVAITDAEGVIQYVGQSVGPAFGYEPEELVGRSTGEFGHPDEYEQSMAQWVEMLGTPERTQRLVSRLRDKKGRWRTVESSMVNLLDNPAVGGVVVNMRDITEQVEAEAARTASEVLFRTVLQQSTDVTSVVDGEGTIRWISPNVEPIFGYSVDEVVGMRGWDWIHPDDVDQSLQRFTSLLNAESLEFPSTIRLRHKNGSWRWVDLVATNFLDNPDVGGIAVNIRDVTSRINAEVERERLTDIIQATSDLVAVTNREGRLLYVNDACRRFFGIHPSDMSEFRFDPHTPEWAQQRYEQETLPALQQSDIWSGELAFYQGDREVPVSAVFMAHRDEQGHLDYVSSVIRDISERKEFEATLEHQATHDPLTGLPNRKLLLDRLGVALSRALRFRTGVAVLFLDLDHFKVVNDSLGHELGDKLLKATSERLKEALREGGDTVARFGGDEFVILCEDLADKEDALRIAERVEGLLSKPFALDDNEVFVTVSTGISYIEGSGATTVDPDDLIRDADAAMYRAKDRGRNRFELFDRHMRAQAVDRLGMETSLRWAVDRHELRVHYQPLVDLKSGLIIGNEALVRWEHPEKGLLLPGEFIRVAEETGLIVPMGKWVMRQAVHQAQRWQAEQPDIAPLRISVNLSARQLNHAGLVAEVRETLEETGVDPALVHFEITENCLVDDMDTARQVLGALKRLGVRVVVDDFGTGYSSLSHLHHFPVDLIKIDQSFVAGLGHSKGDTAIVTAVVSLAHALGLEAVAEGVETEKQLSELRRLGCDYAQGFFLARPQPEHAIGALLAETPTF